MWFLPSRNWQSIWEGKNLKYEKWILVIWNIPNVRWMYYPYTWPVLKTASGVSTLQEFSCLNWKGSLGFKEVKKIWKGSWRQINGRVQRNRRLEERSQRMVNCPLWLEQSICLVSRGPGVERLTRVRSWRAWIPSFRLCSRGKGSTESSWTEEVCKN